MKINKCFLIIILLFVTNLLAEDEFITIFRDNVNYKFLKTDTNWINEYLIYDLAREWDPETFEAFNKLDDKNGIAIDLGAWIGMTAICLSNKFFHVIAIEADYKSLGYLLKNLKASECENVTICPYAISIDGKPVIFGPRKELGNALNNSTSIIKSNPDSIHDYVTNSMTLQQIVDEFVNKNEKLTGHKISFIKCDIEGGEESLLESILEYALKNQTQVYIGFHYSWWKNKNIKNYEPLFQKFTTYPQVESVSKFIISNPFGSFLFKPK